MGAATFQACVKFTKDREGLFSNDPNDTGGATMEGVTFGSFTSWRLSQGLPAPTVDDLKAISDDEWLAFAGARYWNPLYCDAMPAGLDLSNFDFGFNAGDGSAARALQVVLGMTGRDVDGWIGPVTLGFLAKADPVKVLADVTQQQETYYRGLAQWSRYGSAWLARTELRFAAGKALMGVHLPVPVTPAAIVKPVAKPAAKPAVKPKPKPVAKPAPVEQLSEADVLNQAELDRIEAEEN